MPKNQKVLIFFYCYCYCYMTRGQQEGFEGAKPVSTRKEPVRPALEDTETQDTM